MATLKQINEDLIKVHPIVKKIVVKALKEGIKDGQTILFKAWNPIKGFYWEKRKFNYYHKIYGLYPNISDKIGATGSFAQNYYTIKKNSKSDEISL